MNLRRYLFIDEHLYSIYVTYNIQDCSNDTTIKISSYMPIFCYATILHYMTESMTSTYLLL